MRTLLVTVFVAMAAGCLPTRDRIAFEDGTDPGEDASTPDTGGEDSGSDDMQDGSSADAQTDTTIADTGGDACTPQQSVEELCTANGAACGMLGVTDSCGTSRTIDCGGCSGGGVGCVQNSCLETNCRDNQDNDQSGAGDCDDPNCRGERCSNSPNKVCQTDGSCS